MTERVRKKRERAEASGVREEQKEQTREALLRAAETLIAADGVDGPSLDAICARAGYTRGAFYVHFEDRDALLEALLERVGRRYLDGIFAEVTAVEGQGLEAVAERFLSSIASGTYPLAGRKGVRPHQLLQACARSAALRKRYVALLQETVERLSAVLAAGQRSGKLRSDVAPDSAAMVLLCSVIGAHTLLELRAPLELGAAAGTLLQVFSAGEVTEPAAR